MGFVPINNYEIFYMRNINILLGENLPTKMLTIHKMLTMFNQ